jgi:hypothetical protein
MTRKIGLLPFVAFVFRGIEQVESCSKPARAPCWNSHGAVRCRHTGISRMAIVIPYFSHPLLHGNLRIVATASVEQK